MQAIILADMLGDVPFSGVPGWNRRPDPRESSTASAASATRGVGEM
jgi:hypothetical protein